MYTPTGHCSAILHLLIKHPVLIVVMGLYAASGHLSGTYALEDELEQLKYEQYFQAIKMTESNNMPIGVHLDGISYGPAGLTKIALRDVLQKIPGCEELSDDELTTILKDPVMSEKIARLYFFDLIYQFDGDIEIAIAAYNNGPTRIRRVLKGGWRLPREYLDKVLKNYQKVINKK